LKISPHIDIFALNHSWINEIKENGAACIIAEGLMMYLPISHARNLVASLQERFPKSQMAFDIYSRMAAKGAANHPSLKKSGTAIHWGLDDIKEIEEWRKGIKCIGEWFFTDSAEISNLPFQQRILFPLQIKFRQRNVPTE
jgi:O-methyltransferase involved in polyketide biosynthesis